MKSSLVRSYTTTIRYGLLLAALVAASCERAPVYAGPGGPFPIVLLSPDSAVVLVGAQLRLTPVVTGTGATRYRVLFTSSNPGVATVDSEGLVEARAIGTATIQASLTIQPSAGSSAHIRVTEGAPNHGISVLTLTDTAGTPVDPSHVHGVVVAGITLDVPRGSDTLNARFRLDTAVACDQVLPPGQPTTASCRIDTRAPIGGSPVPADGYHTLALEVRNRAGVLQASATQTIRMDNASASARRTARAPSPPAVASERRPVTTAGTP